MATRAAPPAERLLDAAMRLFAQRGYDATSVGDIQVAAGMTHGSGALYKHFPSKQALLEAGIERFIEDGARERTALDELPTSELSASLAAIAAAVGSSPTMDGDMLRIIYRELGNFRQLRDTVRARRLQAVFHDVAAWLRRADEQGDAHVEDAEATAAVLLSSLVFFQLLVALADDTPGGVDRAGFTATWTALATRALTPPPPARRGRSTDRATRRRAR